MHLPENTNHLIAEIKSVQKGKFIPVFALCLVCLVAVFLLVYTAFGHNHQWFIYAPIPVVIWATLWAAHPLTEDIDEVPLQVAQSYIPLAVQLSPEDHIAQLQAITEQILKLRELENLGYTDRDMERQELQYDLNAKQDFLTNFAPYIIGLNQVAFNREIKQIDQRLKWMLAHHKHLQNDFAASYHIGSPAQRPSKNSLH